MMDHKNLDKSIIWRVRSYLSKRLDPGKIQKNNPSEENKWAVVVDALQKKLTQKEPFLPRIIHLETRSRCNGQCTFCLAAVKTDPRPDSTMPDTLIDKILTELSDLDFNNRLSLYNNNEPLMDKRIFDIVGKARQMLPKAYLEIKTNGKSLTLEKTLRLFNAGLDMLYINDYQPSSEVEADRHRPNIINLLNELKDIRRFKGHFSGGHYSERIISTLRSEDDTLYNRAGTSPNTQKTSDPLKSPCLRGFEMMTIDPSGNVGLCSDDVLISTNMGNVSQTSIHSIWTSPAYDSVRQSLLAGDRTCKSACQVCNNKGHTWEIFHELNPEIGS